MFSTGKVIFAILFFSCLGLLVSSLGFLSDRGMSGPLAVLEDFPVSGWRQKTLSSSQAMLDTLQADVTVFSDYFRRPEESSVNLYIGYYGSLEKAKLSHAPQVCFTAQGWIIRKNDKVDLVVEDKSRKVNRLVLEKEKQRLLVYYWYQTDDRVYADLFRMKLSLLYKKLKGDRIHEGNAFVRIYTPISSNPEQAGLLLKSYADSLDPAVEQLFALYRRN